MFGQRPGNRQPIVKRAITPEHLIVIFGVLVRNKVLFVKVKPSFLPEILNNPGEEFHSAFLRMLLTHFEATNELPVQGLAVAEMTSLARENHSGFSEKVASEETLAIYSLLAISTPEEVRSTEFVATQLLRELIIDRRVVMPTRSALLNASNASLANPGDIFEAASRNLLEVQRLLNRSTISSVPQVRQRLNNYVSFDQHMDFLNALTQGGLHRKTVSGLFGVFGGCKTTVATQAAACRISLEWNKHLRGEESEIVVFANCEGAPEEISFRVLSFLSKIPARRIRDHFNSIHPLRDYVPTDPDDYQVKYGIALPETVRLEEAIEKIDKFLKIIDLSGSTEGSDVLGKGYVSDLEMMTDTYCQESGKGVSLFILDYAKAFTRRYMDLNGISAEQIRHHLGRLPDYVRRQVSDKFNCASLILQQMNKAALSKKPGTLLSHVDSSEASDFGENCWFCFTLSQPTKDSDDKLVVNMNMSKARDVEPPRKMPSLEYIPYCQGLRLTDEFRIVNNSLQHVEARNVAVTNEAPQRRATRSARVPSVTSDDMNPN
jgi:hypothetical protein